MRPLNRPMFRYGGPIKEGIMNGMQNRPGYQDAGKVGQYFSNLGKKSLNLINPLKKIPGGKQIMQSGFVKGFLTKPNTPVLSGTKGKFFDAGIPFATRVRNLFPTGKFLQPATPKGMNLGYRGAKPPIGGSAYQTAPLSLKEAFTSPQIIGQAIRENPITTYLAAGQIKNAPEILGGAYDIGKGTLQGAANYLLGTNFGKDVPKETGSDVTLERTDKITTVPNEGTGAVETPKTEAEKAKINEDRINETREKYYKLMGIDKMNKKAAYNSLIDASKIVQEEGGDLKGAIRSGNLQNRIISAISKNLDSSADLKKQINAAILKGEIEKDIKQSDPANAVLNELRLLQGKKLKKDLEGSSVADMIAIQNAKSPGTVTSDNVTDYIRSKGTDALTLPDDKFQKWERNENNKNKDEIDYFQENYSGLDDGIYVVNKRAVQKSGNQIAFVDLDEIIG